MIDLYPVNIRRDPLDDLWGSLAGVIDPVSRLMWIAQTPKWFIAGGFLRDYHSGIQWKDVDVFIPGDMPPEASSDDAIRYDLDSVTEATLDVGIEVNLIGMKRKLDLADILSRMDIGLCQIGMRPDGEVVATKAYLDDYHNKTITVLWRPYNASDRDHIDRVRRKYPNHTIIYKYEETQ